MMKTKNKFFMILASIIMFSSTLAWGAIGGYKLTPIEILKVTSSSSKDDTAGAAMAIDRNFGSRWASEQNQSPQWLSLELKAPDTVNYVAIDWEWAAAKVHKIQTSSDGKTWHDACEIKDGTFGMELINISPTRAKFVRIYCIKPATEYGYSIHEVGLFKKENPLLITGRKEGVR